MIWVLILLNLCTFITSSCSHQDLTYVVTPGDEVEDMFILLNEVKQQIPSISAVSSGAIASDYQRLRVESVCARLSLVSLSYLWKQDQTFLLEEMIRRDIVAITIKVAAIGLNPAQHLGKELSDLQSHLLQMNEYVKGNLELSHMFAIGEVFTISIAYEEARTAMNKNKKLVAKFFQRCF